MIDSSRQLAAIRDCTCYGRCDPWLPHDIINPTTSRMSGSVRWPHGAELILVSETEGMEGARDLALNMEKNGQDVLNQFANPDCPRAQYETTGPEIWKDTGGQVTHFVSAMGTTGTIMGVSEYLKEQNPEVTIVGAPSDGSKIAGIRRWPIATSQKSSIQLAWMSS